MREELIAELHRRSENGVAPAASADKGFYMKLRRATGMNWREVCHEQGLKAKNKSGRPKLPEECGGCQRQTGKGGCKAITSPRYVWERSGGCWAYTTDPYWEEKVSQEVRQYANSKETPIS